MAVPGAPTIFAAAPDDGKLVIVFAEPASDGGSPITDYQYQVDANTPVSIGIYSNPFEISGLTNGVTYGIKLRAVNADGAGPWDGPGYAAPDATVYYTVTRLSPNTDVARIEFNGSTMPGIPDYPEYVNLYTTSGYVPTDYAATAITNPFSGTYDVAGLLQANGIRWVVGVFPILEYGSYGVVRQVAAAAPTAPRGVTVVPGGERLTVSYLPPISDGGSPITSYSILVYIGATLFGTYGDVSSPYTITGLTAGTTYNVQVVAYNAIGETASALVPGTPTVSAIPGAPTIDSVSAGDEELEVAYSAPADDGGVPITSYEYSIDAGVTYTSVGLDNPFMITGLLNGMSYEVILRAINEIGPGPWSAAFAAMPIASPTAYSRGDRYVRLTFDPTKPLPVHVSSTGLKDALNPRTWNISRLAPTGPVPYTVMSVLQADTNVFDVLTLEQFPRANADSMRVYTEIDGLALEDSTFVTVDLTFSGAIDAADLNPNTKAAAKGLVVRDLANVSITPVGSLIGGDYSEFISGTLVINAAGDYVSTSGESMVRKLIMRRLLSRRGDFFHLPNYGAGLDIKSNFSTANLRIMAKDIEMQVLQEPEIEAARATLTYQAANSILIIQVQAKMRTTGQQTALSLSLPLSGTTQF